MERTIKYQRDVDPEWTHQVNERPGCESLLACMQCGTCSGACPLSIYMDLSPRRIMALVREGFRTEALKSQTIWLCASCYACGVHCPQKIKITDVMYSLKREAIASGLYPRHFPIPVLAREFYKMVKLRGRNAEFWLVLQMALRSHPLMLLGMMSSGWHLWRTGRLFMRRDRIKRVTELQRALGFTKEVN
jgi:quinone-modifying oxidoreductase subunit QmoC